MTHKPTDKTRKIVRDLTMGNCSQEEICYYLRITDDTLRKYYDRELREPILEGLAKLGNDLYKDACNGDKEARKLFLTHRGRWAPYKPPEKQDSTTPQDFETFIKLAKALNESGNISNSK